MDKTFKSLTTRPNYITYLRLPKLLVTDLIPFGLSLWFTTTSNTRKKVMKHQQFDALNVLTVSPNSRCDRYKKDAVNSITDILQVLRLVRYSDSASNDKVVWPYIKYTDKVDHRTPGSLGDSAFFSSALLVSSRKRKLFSVSLRSSEQEKTVKKQKLFSPPVVGRRVRLCVAPPRGSRARRLRRAGISPRPPLAPACGPLSPMSFPVAASPRMKETEKRKRFSVSISSSEVERPTKKIKF
ncbi:uncharacterized protein EV154DRAFT_565079 [Mucor mucedo]|uniref:uncharacterized protein n=1 Tax=Mucor mucedo TaxID=29922 RepID=UPI0022207CA3|nr:uncharacterized protein EV154DRAFT_565079 [Mucor mucedo]KAI7889744.1 hypothetical protein EV154DRAFT_565079 [Mucor mucedo]